MPVNSTATTAISRGERDCCNYPFTSSLRFRNVSRNRGALLYDVYEPSSCWGRTRWEGRKEGRKGELGEETRREKRRENEGKTKQTDLKVSAATLLVALLSLTVKPDSGFSAREIKSLSAIVRHSFRRPYPRTLFVRIISRTRTIHFSLVVFAERLTRSRLRLTRSLIFLLNRQRCNCVYQPKLTSY